MNMKARTKRKPKTAVMKSKGGMKAKAATKAKLNVQTKTKAKIKAKTKTKAKNRAIIKPQKSVKKGVKSRSKSKALSKTENSKVKSTTRRKSSTKIKSRAKSRSKNKVSYIQEGYRSVTPFLIIKGADNAIDFYKQVFGAEEVMRMRGTDGKIVHAEMIIGDSKIMLADEGPERHLKSPESFGGSPVGIHLYMADVDAVIDRAVRAGAIIERPVENMFYGDRIGSIVDPFGHKWSISTHIEDVTEEEVRKRMAAFA